MYNILLFVYVLICIALIGFILVQQGKVRTQVRHLVAVHQVPCLVLQVQVTFNPYQRNLSNWLFVIALVLGNINSHRGNVQKVHLTIYLKLLNKINNSNNKLLQQLKTKITIFRNRNKNRINALVVELVDTLSWGGVAAGRASSSLAQSTKYKPT